MLMTCSIIKKKKKKTLSSIITSLDSKHLYSSSNIYITSLVFTLLKPDLKFKKKNPIMIMRSVHRTI